MKEKTKFISNINFAIELKKCQPQSYEVHFSLIASNIKIDPTSCTSHELQTSPGAYLHWRCIP